MKRFLVALLLVATMLSSGCATLQLNKHDQHSYNVRNSVVHLTRTVDGIGTFTCTGFAIAPRKYMTAAHCVAPIETMFGQVLDAPLKVDGKDALILKADFYQDLAVVIADVVKPSVRLREKGANWLERVWAMGYGNGFSKPLVTEHKVQILGYQFDGMPDVAPGTIYMGEFIGGMSGGPVYDGNGAVVGIVQRGGSGIGYGVTVKEIQKFLEGVQ